uniref:Pib n=1 Tax=Oryza sativa subsp. japonica TaxID=39947 RepID=Q5Z5Z4_ORYSJ|nr:putative Pib [Oryza sativa Japonica Group]
MAELAIGISRTALEELVNKLKSVIKEEEEQWQTMHRDVVFIRDEFEMMQSFLNSADGEVVKSSMARTWVRQVRNLSYDLEDCIEFILHLDTNKRSWWLRLLQSWSCGKGGVSLPVDEAVTEMKKLKARVEDVSQRNTRYRFTNDLTQHQQQLVSSGSATGGGAPGFDILAEARDTAARRKGVVDLIKLITEKSNDLRVISLWGTGDDLGTMSIVRNMYDDSRIHDNFRCRAWVKVAHPINPHELVRSLVVQFYANSCQQQLPAATDALSWFSLKYKKQRDALSSSETSTGELVKEFLRHVDTHRYLIILEDLSTMVQWDAIWPYLRGGKNGSRVLVSTRHHEIASLCTGKPHRVLELQRISIHQSICIFFKECSVPAEAEKEGGVPTPKHVDWSGKNRLIIGRDSEVDKLFNLIKDRSHTNTPHVVSVWGIPGTGRTALVSNVYYRCYYDTQFDRQTTVNMPQPYNLRGFCRCLLVSGLDSGLSLIQRREDPIQQCREILHRDRCLVIIDEVHSKEDWDSITDANLITATSKSCIVVITTQESVAVHCAGANGLVCSITCLQATAASDLFQQILSRSGGLPQVIVALARYWANQYMSNIEDKREREWQCQYLIANFMQELQTSQEFYCLRGLFAWMHSYFCSCPPSLMRSMLYLLIFPQGKTFRRRRLVRRWIAEGYASGSESNSLEEMGELFHKLSSQSVIRQATMDGCYEFNGFFHEYMISRPVEERILLPLEVSVLEGYCWRLTTKGDIGQHRGEATLGGLASPLGQHLAIWNSWDRNKTLFDSLDLLRLRSLTVFGPWESFFISNKMGVLRVLDLEDACDVTDVDVENIGKVLHRLKFLSLRGHKITYLPDSFGGLRHLQTLDIRCTSIINLPTSITKLKKLQYVRAGNPVPVPLDDDTSTDGILRLRPPPPEAASATASPSLSEPSTDATAVSRLFELRETWTSRHRGQQPAVAGTCNGGIVVPRGIRKMTTLHTLGVIDVSVAKKGRAILEELKNLTQLRKLGVSGISRRNCREFCSAISGHAHLESLSVHLNKENNRGCLDAISKPPENLKSLKLYGYADDKLPEWITLLRKLSKLNLQMAMLPSGDGLQFHSGFDSLVILKISCSPSLQAVTFHSGVMPSLECLKLRCCNVSSLRLSGLEALTGLKEVWFGGSYREAFKRELKRQIGQLPREMKPVLKEEQRLP